MRILIVSANYYSHISKDLVSDAQETLDKKKIKYKIINVSMLVNIFIINYIN